MPAKIYPEDWEISYPQITRGEKKFAYYLIENLDDEWIVFPNFEFFRGNKVTEKTGRPFGEIDFIVLSPCGVLHLIELKDHTGVFASHGKIFAPYENRDKPKDITKQLNAQVSVIGSTLNRLRLSHLVCK